MSMKISEAMNIIEESGLLLERIKKYRTTAEERDFRDNRSAYDHDSIESKMWKIAEEEGMTGYIIEIGFDCPYFDGLCVEFKDLGEFGEKLVDRIGEAVCSDIDEVYEDLICFKVEEISKRYHKKKSFFDKFLDRLGVPEDEKYRQSQIDAGADKFVTNQYGFQKRIDEIYAKFRKFCRLFKREYERQRGNLTKLAEAEV